MKIICPKCQEVLGEVTSVARLLLQVHCPFDGYDFGLPVDPLDPPTTAPATTGAAVPAGS